LNDKTICVDPGHGGTAHSDSFRVGPGGEREEWINLRAVSLFKMQNKDSLQKSFDLFSRSARSFPDSWLAGNSHMYRSRILLELEKNDEALIERKRVSEYYIKLK
jgi:hypothetical protein